MAWYADGRVLGVERSIEPRGALPYLARRVDAETPPGEHEAELAVEALHVDATSYRELRERCAGDRGRMAEQLAEVDRAASVDDSHGVQPWAVDPHEAARLWTVSVQLTGVDAFAEAALR